MKDLVYAIKSRLAVPCSKTPKRHDFTKNETNSPTNKLTSLL